MRNDERLSYIILCDWYQLDNSDDLRRAENRTCEYSSKTVIIINTIQIRKPEVQSNKSKFDLLCTNRSSTKSNFNNI